MGRGSFSIGSIAGIRIGLHPSWLVIAFLVTFLASDALASQFRGWNDTLYWLVGAGVAVLFFGSVLAHELSHAFVARRFGLKVRDITLFIFGGAASLEGDAPTPRAEAFIAAAGPLTSVAVGLVLVGASFVIPQPLVRDISGWLGAINLTLGVFNLIPGFPMDGGRILRAIIWKVRGDEFAATRMAATVGRAFGYLLIAGGVWWAFNDQVFNGIWLALIGWFLSNTAESAIIQSGVARSIRGVKVRDVMDPEPPSVSPNETVASLVEGRLMRGEHRSFLVRHEDGGLAGIVTLSDVRRVAREDWASARVTDVMTRYSDLATVSPDHSLEAALELLQKREVNQLPVVVDEGRSVVGLLTRAGILRLIDTRLKLGV